MSNKLAELKAKYLWAGRQAFVIQTKAMVEHPMRNFLATLQARAEVKETLEAIGDIFSYELLEALDSDHEQALKMLAQRDMLEDLNLDFDFENSKVDAFKDLKEYLTSEEGNLLNNNCKYSLKSKVRGYYRRIERLRRRKAYVKEEITFLRTKLVSDFGSNQQRSKWEADFRKLVKLVKKSALFTYGESDLIGDEDHALIAASAVARACAKVSNSHDTYAWKSSVKLHASHTHKEGTLAVNYDDFQRGESESIISILSECFKDPTLVHQIKGWDLKIDDNKAWSLIANICRQQGLIPAANNGSKALLKLEDNGQLSRLCKIMDCMASNMSEAFVYLLGLINGSGENKLGVKDDISEPLTGKDKDGRDIIAIVYDSNECGLLIDPDGSGVTNFINEENIGQTRFWAVDEESGYGLFAKGQQANARFTVFRNEKTDELEMFKITDLVNLESMTAGQLQSRGYTKAEQETLSIVDDMWDLQENDSILFDKMVNKNHVIYKGKNQFDLVDQQIKAWEAWFDAKTDAPWVVGLEVGQVKCKAKNHFNKVAKVDEASLKKAMKATAHGIAELSLGLYGVVIIKSPSWKISSTSLNFQPMSLMISNSAMGEDIEQFYARYCLESNTMLDSFGDEALSNKETPRWKEFTKALNLEANIADWPGALRTNFQSKLWRWFTNFNKTSMPTRRVLMHAMQYRGIGIVDDSFCYKELARQCASWRGPLISYMALQAPVFVSLKSSVKLKAYIESEDFGEYNELHRYYTLFKERILFKNKLKSIADKTLVKFLDEIIRIATIFNVTDALTLMHTKDIEDMQGDDDGDTVVVDPDPYIVAKFIFTEEWWVQFLEKNNIKPLELEQPKSSQIEFRTGCRYLVDVAKGGEVSALTSEEQNAIENYGLHAPKLAKKFGLSGTKIPNPLGLTFAEFFDINKEMGEAFTSDDDSFGIICKKLGTSTAGPIGPPSNCAPDLLIKALANVNEEGKMNDDGLFLFEGYKNMSSQVQISIDFGKRIVDIINSFLFGSSRLDDSDDLVEYPRFYEQIKPEVIKPFLAKNNPSEVYIVKVFDTNLSQQCNILRFVESSSEGLSLKDFDREEDFWLDLVEFDSKKLRYIAPDLLGYLLPESPFQKVKSPNGRYTAKVKVVTVKDPDNYCFDFNSIYDYAGYVLECVYPEMKPSVWKNSLTNLLSEELRPLAQDSLSSSAKESALVEHTTTFFKWYDSQPKVQQLMDVAPAFVSFAKQSDIGKQIDTLYPQVKIATAAFFSEEYEMTKGQPSPSKIMNAAAKAYGFDVLDLDKLLNGEQVEVTALAKFNDEGIKVKEVSVNIFDVIVSCARFDESYLNPKIVQSLWQILIDAYLKNESESELVKDLVKGTSHYFAEFTNSLVNTKLPDSHRVNSIASSPDTYMRNLKVGNNELFKLLIDKAYVLEKQGLNRKYYSWSSVKSIFKTLTLLAVKAKEECVDRMVNKLLDQESELFGYALDLVKEDSFNGALSIISAVKGAFVQFDNTIRYFDSLSRMTFFPVNPYVKGRSKIINSSKDVNWYDTSSLVKLNSTFSGYSKGMISHPVNLYANMLDPLTVLKLLNDSKVYLPLQENRLAQWVTVKAIAKQGHYVKSYSFFNNSGWKCPFTVSLLDSIVTNASSGGGVSLDVKSNDGSKIIYNPNKSFYEQITNVRFLGMIGLDKSTFGPTFNACSKETQMPYYKNLEALFDSVDLGEKEVLVWRNAPSGWVTKGQMESVANAMYSNNIPDNAYLGKQLYVNTHRLYIMYRFAATSTDGAELVQKLKGLGVQPKIGKKGIYATLMGMTWSLEGDLSFLTAKLLKLISLVH